MAAAAFAAAVGAAVAVFGCLCRRRRVHFVFAGRAALR